MKTLLLLLCACTLAALETPPDALPLGHPDFRPSDAHPIGLLGDWTGVFPGATPPTAWDYRTGANVKWSVELPGWGFGSPITVGDRLFLTVERDRLLCYDRHDGTLLWQDRVSGLDLLPPAQARVLDAVHDELMAYRGDIFAVMYEYYRLAHVLARIEEARSGEKVKDLFGKWGVFSLGPNVGGSPGLGGHLTPAEEAEQTAKWRQVSDDERAKLQARKDELRRLIDEKGYHSGNGYVHSHVPYSRGVGERQFKGTPKGQEYFRRWALVNHFGIVPDTFQAYTGQAFFTPASDGERVYCAFGTGQVSCHDLEGRRLWLRSFQLIDPSIKGDKAFDDRHMASPVLTEDAVVAMWGHNAIAVLGGQKRWLQVRSLDKLTGRVRWSHRFDDQGGHDVPQLMRLNSGGVDLIVTNMGPVFETATGRVVMDHGMRCCALPTETAPGTVLLHDANPGGGRTFPSVLLRFTRQEDGSTAHEELWRYACNRQAGDMFSPLCTTLATFRGHLVGTSQVADARTGRVVAKLPRSRAQHNRVIAGTVLISQSSSGPCTLVDVADPTKPRQVGTGLCGSSRMRRFLKDELDWDAVRRDLRAGVQLMECSRLFTANPWPVGRQLYIRSQHDLYCLEDAGDAVDPKTFRR